MVKFFSEWIFDYSTYFFLYSFALITVGDALLPWLHQMKEQIFHLVWVFIGLDLSHEQQKKLSPVCCCSYGNLGYQVFKGDMQN